MCIQRNKLLKDQLKSLCLNTKMLAKTGEPHFFHNTKPCIAYPNPIFIDLENWINEHQSCPVSTKSNFGIVIFVSSPVKKKQTIRKI